MNANKYALAILSYTKWLLSKPFARVVHKCYLTFELKLRPRDLKCYHGPSE